MSPIVPNAEVRYDRLRAYAQKSVAAGNTMQFRVSSTVPYRLRIARLGWDTDSPSRDWVIRSYPPAPALQRSVRPGSYIHVERGLPASTTLPRLTLECWVRPYQRAWQGLISQYTFPNVCGFGLFLDDVGRARMYFGDGSGFRAACLSAGGAALPVRQWTHVVAVFEAGAATLWLNGSLDHELRGLPAKVTPGAAPLRIGAYGEAAATSHFLDGDLALPVIYGRVLKEADIRRRTRAQPPTVPNLTDVLGCWPLDEEKGSSVRDASTHARKGAIVNRGTWMIGGPGFDAGAVPRFGPHDAEDFSTRGHALRLSSHDLYDCGWPVTHEFAVPPDLPPGLYVGRFEHGASGIYDVTFVVRRAGGRPPAPLVVLCATNTWLAYNGPFSGSNLPSFDLYDDRPGGLPTYQVGIEMPWEAAGPYLRYADPQYNYSHLTRAERLLHVWLEQNRYDYDLISDFDLDANPAQLRDHRVLVIAGHSEYWSARAYGGVQSFLAGGGRVVVAAGNTMFWRVSFDAEVMECRKLALDINGNVTVGGRPYARWGELYHTHDRKRGGLMREAGYPAWRAIGLECVGYGGSHLPFRVRSPGHVFFRSPEVISVVSGADLGGPHGVGHEWDVRLSQIPGSSSPLLPVGFEPTALADARANPGSRDYFDYRTSGAGGSDVALSEIVDWTRPDGGRVFAAGSIAAAAALHTDEKLSSLFRNALHHLGVVFRLNVLAVGQDGRFRNKWFDGQSWGPSPTDWQDMGGAFVGSPAGIQWAPNRLGIMAVTASGTLSYRHWTGSAWSGWVDFGGALAGRPAVAAWGRHRLEIFARGSDGHLRQKSWDGGAWRPAIGTWQDLGDQIGSDPTAAVWEGDQLAVAALGALGNVVYKWWSQEDGWRPSATGFQDMGGTFAHAPTLVAWGGNRINLFAVAADGRLSNKWWNGSAWNPSVTGWQDLGGALASPVLVAVRGGKELSLFAIGSDGRMKAKWWNGVSWGPSLTGWQDLGGDLIGEPAVATYRGHHVSLIAVGRDCRLRHKLWNGSAWLPSLTDWFDFGGDLRASAAIFSWLAT